MPSSSQPNYPELVRFLVQPLLESPQTLRIDCETYAGEQRVWIRLSFASVDKGRVFGRGGRTIQAIRTVLAAAALDVGQQVHLEVLDGRDSTAAASAEVKKPVIKRR
ncbi:KH domain-containing protein [Synechococcales cyanobacterium C]|uniref:KH domain-containing protein n=1 Tax=Petrachloros mirabilis ULC683 TaxID=2781853 RepID=A0A8K2A0E7_9CYAN|nr:KH domain-containing protein [Petrachloros mirabilis]NCJ07423.1 KH domain-containing protein [Petrachloros mirabilis ULC683]